VILEHQEFNSWLNILNIILSQDDISNPISPYICIKDPENLKYTSYLSKLSPKSKFILMIRDGRATVNSLVKYKFFGGNYVKTFEFWNKVLALMYGEYKTVSLARCLPVITNNLFCIQKKK
jgi:hypothetical protein